MKAAPDLKKGDRVVVTSLPIFTTLKLGQFAVISRAYSTDREDFVMLEGMEVEPIFAHRVRKLTPLDEELS